MIGTRGVPARYGGFETAVEEVGRRLAARHEILVYCRDKGARTYEGMSRIYMPSVKRRSLETLTHSGLSVLHAIRNADVAILFNAANAPFLPVFRGARLPVAVHVDGLESKRQKWAGFGARYYRWAERSAATSGAPLIADSRAIQQHLLTNHGVDSTYIAYGLPAPTHVSASRLDVLRLSPGEYHLVIARMEPENHVLEMVSGYRRAAAKFPLVVVGDAPYSSPYKRAIAQAAAGDPKVRFLGAVWDQSLLDVLYAGAALYCHGHSVGGTNPSLLRAIGQGAPTAVWEVPFNAEVTAGFHLSFEDANTFATCIERAEVDRAAMVQMAAQARKLAKSRYNWDDVADAYERLAVRLALEGHP